MPASDEDLRRLCRAEFGQVPSAVAFPGGRGRKTVIVDVAGARYAVSRRKSEGRARLEAAALAELGDTGLVPGLVAARGALVIQEFVTGPRLSTVLDGAEPREVRDRLEMAIGSLIELQDRGSRSPLFSHAPQIGLRAGWTDDLLATPARLAESVGLTAPVIDTERAKALIAVRQWRFVKWDARPGNAIIRGSGHPCWIDWEHCGRRSGLDDIAWLLADEWCPVSDAAEGFALDALSVREGMSRDETAAGLRTMAVLHSFVRLSLILHHKGAGPWWSHDTCLRDDRIGVTHAHLRRVCARASAWSESVAELRPLAELLRRIEEQVGGR